MKIKKYRTSVEYKPRWKDGRRITSPKWKRIISTHTRKTGSRGALGFKKHLEEVYGKSNVRKFRVYKVKGRRK